MGYLGTARSRHDLPPRDLARAAATQFVWRAIRGIPKHVLIASLADTMPLLGSEWRAAALAEPWVLAEDEVDWPKVVRV